MKRHEDFYTQLGTPTDVTVGNVSVRLPLTYHDNELFMSLHTASFDGVAAQLPSERIRPARWIDGRAVIAISAFRYRTITWTSADGATGTMTPYGEISVGAVVTQGEARRALPLLTRNLRVFVLHLPVTTREACDGGRQVWGFPKFVADMDFSERQATRRVRLSEGGGHILTLTVRPSGPVMADRTSPVTYTVLNGELLQTEVPMIGHRQMRLGGRSGELQLGDHAVANDIRGLDISTAPIATFNYVVHHAILGAGRPVAPARSYHGYFGAARELGRFTVEYPGTTPLDQYATLLAAQPATVTLPEVAMSGGQIGGQI